MPEVQSFLSLEDGRVLKMLPGDPKLSMVLAQPQSFVPIETVASRIQYQWLDDFIRTVEDDELRGRVQAAANGKGAFRRFKDILLTMPEERRRWFEFRDQKMRQRIVEWVREKGIEPTNEPNWVAGAADVPVAPTPNRAGDVEALRGFLARWVDTKQIGDHVQPQELEELVQAVARRFRIRPLGQSLSAEAVPASTSIPVEAATIDQATLG
jgi:ribosomal protein S18 acetylase RimI-like enzyme